MKELTAKQKEIVAEIEKLISIKLKASYCKRNIITIDLNDNKPFKLSDDAKKIERIVTKYKIGKTEPNGFSKIAIIF